MTRPESLSNTNEPTEEHSIELQELTVGEPESQIGESVGSLAVDSGIFMSQKEFRASRNISGGVLHSSSAVMPGGYHGS